MRRTTALLLSAALLLPACRARQPQVDVGRLVADLRSDDPRKSGTARLKLVALGEPAVPALAELLRSGVPAERAAAANTLWGMGARARAAVPDLAAALADPDPSLRVTVAMALESAGTAAAPAVPALVRALGDRDSRVRQAAVKALGAIGPGARAALPALTRELRRNSWPEAEEAVRRIQGTEPVGAPQEPTQP
jgi:HEAT repeat protein